MRSCLLLVGTVLLARRVRPSCGASCRRSNDRYGVSHLVSSAVVSACCVFLRCVRKLREVQLTSLYACLTCALQLEGVSPEEHRRLARELAERQRQCATMELELRAALDKLEVYRWADDAAATAPAAAAAPAGALTVAGMSQQPDDEKSIEELRAELEQLRQAMALQGEEAQKVSYSALFRIDRHSGLTGKLMVCANSNKRFESSNVHHSRFPRADTCVSCLCACSCASCLILRPPSVLRPRQHWRKHRVHWPQQRQRQHSSWQSCAGTWTTGGCNMLLVSPLHLKQSLNS